MVKKLLMIVMAFTLFIGFTATDSADARRGGGGGFKSGTKSYTTTPKKSTDSTTSTTSKSSTTSGTTGTTGKTGGFFSGGSLMRGMMIGGFAGLLFGGAFSNMGGFGELLGLAFNLIIIFAVVKVAMYLFRRNKEQRKEPRYNDNGNGRY